MPTRKTLLLNSSLTVVLVAVIAICLNFLSAGTFVRFDLSRSQEFSLSPAARSILESLDSTLHVEVFLSGELPAQFAQHTQGIRDKLAEFQAVSPQVEVRFTDPGKDNKSQERARRLGVTPRETSTRSKGKIEAQVTWLGLSLHYRDRSEALPFIDSVALLEYELARAIRNLQTEQTRKVLGCITGRGEPDLAAIADDGRSPLRPIAQLLQESYELRAVTLDEGIAEDIDVLLLMGSQKPLSAGELFAVDQYVMKGGALGIFPLSATPDPTTRLVGPAPADFSQLLQPWGIEVGTKLIVDRELNGVLQLPAVLQTPRGPIRIHQPMNSPLVPIARDLDREHPISRRIQTVAVPFGAALDLSAAQANPEIDAVVLIATAPDSTIGAETSSLDPRLMPAPSAAEQRGPHTVMAALSGRFESAWKGTPPAEAQTPGTATALQSSPPGTRIVIGSSFEMPLANPALLIAAIDWMAADETLLGIRPRFHSPAILKLPAGTSQEVLKQANVVGPPLLLALFGFLRLRRRALRGG